MRGAERRESACLSVAHATIYNGDDELRIPTIALSRNVLPPRAIGRVTLHRLTFSWLVSKSFFRLSYHMAQLEGIFAISAIRQD